MPDPRISDLLALSPALWAHGAALLAFVVAAISLLRNALMLEGLRSRGVTFAVRALTLLPAFVVAAVLVFAAARHPDRAWANLGVAAAAYVAWYLAGLAARVVRPDLDGDDPRWIAIGACVSFPVGVLSAVVFA